MDIQAIGSRAFTVYIGEPELHRRNIEPQSMTVSDARELVRGVLDDSDTGSVSLELYPGRHELLIFVRRNAGEPEFYSFPDLEALLEALAALSPDAASSLFFYNGAYILAVWPVEGARVPALCEFGAPLPRPGAFLLHLREHGKIIREGDAAEAFLRAFGRQTSVNS